MSQVILPEESPVLQCRKDEPIDTKYFVITENLPLCPIIFFRHDLGPLGTGYIRFPTVYN